MGIQDVLPYLLDYGMGGIFIAYLIYQDHTRMKRIMTRVDQIESKLDLLFNEQRVQDQKQQDKLFELLKGK